MEEVLNNDGSPNGCFGCGPDNERGLRMQFETLDSGEVECRYTAEENLCGPDGVIHGGIQASLLDEVMGMAAHAGPDGQNVQIVTADFQLRYRRPAPVGRSLVIRARLLRIEGRNFHVEGEIIGPEGNAVTVATARWVRIDIPSTEVAAAEAHG